ncbi:hypothetical protein [Planctomycetes bacterium Pla163]|uniref:hypothetical protein n=1 Tax=Rohdeia mirabilis TaxID=2528008 RepID=UPI00119F9687
MLHGADEAGWSPSGQFVVNRCSFDSATAWCVAASIATWVGPGGSGGTSKRPRRVTEDLADGDAPRAGGELGLEVTRVVYAAYLSAERGRRVLLDRLGAD